VKGHFLFFPYWKAYNTLNDTSITAIWLSVVTFWLQLWIYVIKISHHLMTWVAFFWLFSYLKVFLFFSFLWLFCYGGHVISHIMMQTNRVSKNKLVGYCEIDLLEFLAQVNNLIIEWLLTANMLKSLAYMLKVSLFLSCQALDKKKKKLSLWLIYLQGNLDDFELWWKNVTIC